MIPARIVFEVSWSTIDQDRSLPIGLELEVMVLKMCSRSATFLERYMREHDSISKSVI